MDADLVARVRALLEVQAAAVREVRMFGGLSFMVAESLRVAVRGDGDLLVRVPTACAEALLERPGAAPAMMRGREMSAGWLAIGPEGIAADEELAFWVGIALEPIGNDR